jgi:aldose 1-epimerase
VTIVVVVSLTHLMNNNLTVAINADAGARISSFLIDGHEVLRTHDEDTYGWGMYPMVPYAGRVRDATFTFKGNTHSLPVVTNGHALHGTVMHQTWNHVNADNTSAVFETSLGNDWPFHGTCTHRISLLEDRLRCVLSVTAIDDMPVQLGWHPWFRGGIADTDFNAMLQRDANGITTSQRVAPATENIDDCFLEPNKWPRVAVGDATIEVASDCPFWVRYDAPSGDVCIEPQSGPPNGINDAPLVLIAGETFSRWMELRIVKN